MNKEGNREQGEGVTDNSLGGATNEGGGGVVGRAMPWRTTQQMGRYLPSMRTWGGGGETGSKLNREMV